MGRIADMTDSPRGMPGRRPTHHTLLLAWLRVSMAGALTLALSALSAGRPVTTRDLLTAAAVAVIPPIIRWLDPKDSALGSGETRA